MIVMTNIKIGPALRWLDLAWVVTIFLLQYILLIVQTTHIENMNKALC